MSRPCRECAPLFAAVRWRHRQAMESADGAMQELLTRVATAEAERDDALARLEEAVEQMGRFALDCDLAMAKLAQAGLHSLSAGGSGHEAAPTLAASPPLNERGQV